MKILLISGHGDGDCGAVGNGYQEYFLTREFTNALKRELKAYVDIDIYDTSKNAYKEYKKGTFNIGAYDYVLEVHFNSFTSPKAHGTEIYVTSKEKGISVEKAILQRLSKYFKNRGIVRRDDLAVIRTIKNKGISSALLEVCFISNANDMKTYQANKNAIIKSVAMGIVEGFGLNAKTYTIKKGDTLFSIAKRFLGNGNRYTNILKLNPTIKADNLQIGTTIKIPK